ncbi:septation ring formation regulator ezra [Ligilactobacillus saerimneri DSM 16049]|nr:septation ring formation regulator ezra [Ligilactobacillus saerimneri DSM 16049]
MCKGRDQVMVAFFVVVVLAAVGIYLGILYLQKKYTKLVAEKHAAVLELTDTELSDDFNNLKRLNLTGDSLTQFNKIDKSYRYLMNRQLPEISENLNTASQHIAAYQLIAAKKNLGQVDQSLADADEQFAAIKKELVDIQKNTEDQQRLILTLKKKYQAIRKQLLAKNFSYGPVIDKLEENLANLEDEFEQYSKLTASGDFVKSEKPMKQLEKNTSEMEACLESIPPLYNNLKTVFPQQLDELAAGYQKMTAEHYGFTSNVEQMLADIQKDCKENMTNLTQLQIKEAEATDKRIADMIDRLYELMSKEYTAQIKVQNRAEELQRFITHAEQHQKDLLADLERLQQNYELNNNELENAHRLGREIRQIQQQFSAYRDRDEEENVVYTEVLAQHEQMFSSLERIESEQKKIQTSVAGLWKEEKEAQDAVAEFDVEIHKLRRAIERLNLPGVSAEYTDYFLYVSDEIVALDNSLNEQRINMEEITKAMLNTQSDLDVLKSKTEDIIDSSVLVERLMQYSNRYKNRYPEVDAAYQEALRLFNQEYDYVGALDAISHAVDKVEPGVFKRLSDEYQRQVADRR